MKRILLWTGTAIAAVLSILVTASAMAPDLTANIIAHATPSLSPAYSWFASHAVGAGGGMSLAMFGPLLGLKAKNYDELAAASKGGSPEYFPDVLFDQATITSGTAAGVVNFFNATNANSNMKLAGQLETGDYFELGEIHVDVIERTTAETAGAADSAAVGTIDDLYQIMHSSQAIIAFNFRAKSYGTVPLSICRPLGFPRVAVAGAFAAATSTQFGGWDGVGLVYEKTITIPPASKFGVTITFPAALTLSQATLVLRVGLRGVHYRQVG